MGPPAVVKVAVTVLLRLFNAVTPVEDAGPVLGAPPTAAGVATPDGLPAAPGATAQAWPEAAPLAAESLTSTLDEDVRLTFDWLAPATCTRPADVFETLFWAMRPVATGLPELAVVTPAGTGVPGKTVGARATDSPDWALAALVSTMLLVC